MAKVEKTLANGTTEVKQKDKQKNVKKAKANKEPKRSRVKETMSELKKVSWPSWDKLQGSAIVVMVASVIFAIVIFAMDFCFQNLMEFIYTL